MNLYDHVVVLKTICGASQVYKNAPNEPMPLGKSYRLPILARPNFTYLSEIPSMVNEREFAFYDYYPSKDYPRTMIWEYREV